MILEPPTSLRDKLAQLMFVRVGSNLPPVRTVEQDADRVGELLADCPIGGLILFNGQRDQTRETLRQLQSASRTPLLVASDIERGIGQQLLGHELYPHAMAFDSLGAEAEEAVAAFAQQTAEAARGYGLHIAFAPVADVNVDPRNPIIATRAFGSDPQRVAQLVSAYVRGCQAGGLLPTAKHFPGHGNTHEDSHHMLPTVQATRAELQACELVPFSAAIEAGVPLIMTAHVQYDSLDGSGKPATLSHPILTTLLRDQLGFEGAVVSDSLLMEGVTKPYADEGSLAIDAMLAGVDILLDVAQPRSTLESLQQAVADGLLPELCVAQAFDRLWQLKRRALTDQATPTNIPLVVSDQDEQETGKLAADIARRAIVTMDEDESTLPFSSDRAVTAVLIKPFQTHLDPPEQPLAAALRRQFPQLTYHEWGPELDLAEQQRLTQLALAADQLLIAAVVKPAAWHRFGLLPLQSAWVEQITTSRPVVLASLGSPEALTAFNHAAVKLCAFSDVPVSQQALVERLVDG